MNISLWRLRALAWLAALLLMAPGQALAAPQESPDVSWSGFLSQPSKHTPAWIAYTLLESRKQSLGLRAPRRDMVVSEISSTDMGRTFVYMQRQLFRTPVWGDRLIVEIDGDGVVRQVVGTIHPGLEKKLFHRPLHAAVTARKAAGIAREWLRTVRPSSTAGDAHPYYLPDPSGVRLVYAVDIVGEGYVLVHAMTGRIIQSNI